MIRALPGLALTGLFLLSPAGPGLGGEPAKLEKGVETFDAVWDIIKKTHYDPKINGVDWEGAREELRPKAEEAGDIQALRAVINELLARLGESHFGLLPAESAETLKLDEGKGALPSSRRGDIGLDVRVIDKRAIVSEVEPGRPAAKAGVEPGWIVRSIGDAKIESLMAKVPEKSRGLRAAYLVRGAIASRLRGAPGNPVKVEFEDGEGKVVSLEIPRDQPPGEVSRLGNLPPMNARLDSKEVTTPGGRRVGVIRFNIWLIPISARFDEALHALRSADAIVVDLRGNPGGIGGMTMGIGGHFVTELKPLGTMTMRGNALTFKANPRRVSPDNKRVEPFGKPLAILMDGESASTSEIFAGGMQAMGRARVIGETSAGAALPSMMERLPNGDVLQHAIADYRLPDGGRLEGKGVVPDEVVPLTRADLLAGKDASLEAALRWIDSAPK